MAKLTKRLLTLFITAILLFSPITNVLPGIMAFAVDFDDINDKNVFLKQETSVTCTLASAAMMMRRTAIIAEYADWEDITETSISDTAWIEGLGLRWDYTFYGMTVGHGYYPEDVDHKLFMLDLLERYPQGLVVYNTGAGGQSHAVFLCDYDENEDMFFVADPASSVPEGRIPITESSIVGESQEEQLANLSAFWYVSSPEITLENGKYTSSAGIANPYDPVPDTNRFEETKKAVRKYFVVNTDSSKGAALRNYPSGSSSSYKYVTKGTILYVTHVGQNNFGADWYKLNTSHYIFNTNLIPFEEYSEEVKKFANTAKENEGTYKIASSYDTKTPMRLEPSEGNNIVAYADNDTLLYITHSGVNSVGAKWFKTQEGYYVKACDTEFVSDEKLDNAGYNGMYTIVFGEYSSDPIEDEDQSDPSVKPENYKITASALNLRKTPVDGDILARIPQGAVVEVTAIQSGWGKTEYDGYEGWISLEYAEKVADVPVFKLESIKLSSNSVETGEKVSCTVTVNVPDGCMYKFSVHDDLGKMIYFSLEYDSKNSFEYITKAPGIYYFSVEILSGDGKKLSAFSGNFTVHDKLQLDSVASNVDEYSYVMNEITWTVDTVSGADNAVYTYSLYCDDKLVVELESSVNEFTYTPDKAGQYVLYAMLSDDNSSSETVESDAVSVYDVLRIDSIDSSSSYVVVGDTVSFSANASGGTGEYRYCFTLFKEGKIIKNGTFSEINNELIEFNEEGIYRIFCAVMDSGNMTASEFSSAIEVFAVRLGDVDGDGKISAKDARLVLRHSAHLDSLDDSMFASADANKDGKVNAADARLILRCAAKIEII